LDIESFRHYCLRKEGVAEEMPFGEDTLVFKVMGKIFALTDITLFTSVNLKCAPEQAVQLREQYVAVVPGYHMNKKHWNTILLDGSIGDKLLQSWIDDSYQLVVAGLPRKIREQLHHSSHS
jgi:predicted DNA-binding protein (MmcQ/YjbR family)